MVSHRAARQALIVSLLALLAAAPILAQTTASTLKGTIVDKDGNPLPGVTVVLENPSLGVTGLGGVTNAQGEFRITPVPPGKGYILSANLPSYTKIQFKDIEIPASRTIVQNMTLRPALTERIRVAGKEDVVNTESAKISTTITSEFISGLPVLGRDYQDVLTLAPGVTDVNNTGNPNIHGARDTDVVTLVDGVSTTDPFSGQFGQNLNVESIEEIEVITSGASAEYGRAQGGFVNMITKSGGNEFKGTFKYFMRTQRLDGDGAGIDDGELRGGLGEKNGFRDLKFTDIYPFLSLSGAFIKDHLWYYFAPEYSQIEDPINAGTIAFVARTITARATGKVTWQAAANNKVAFIVLLDDTTFDNVGLNSFTERDSGYTNKRGGPTLTLQDNYLVSPTVSLESTISRFDQKFKLLPTLGPDTNGNGIETIDDRIDLGGDNDGFIDLREWGDPGDDWDRDGRFDVFEDFNRNFTLDGCVQDPITLQRVCREDRDHDQRLTLPFACEGSEREDINCNGRLDVERDTNENGIVDPSEDAGIACANPALCPDGVIPGTNGNGRFDTEDRDGNGQLSTLPGSLDSPFPFWIDRNNNGIEERGEFRAPSSADRQYLFNLNENRISGPFFFTREDSRTRDSLIEDLSYYIDDLLGSHDIKTGLKVEREGYDADIHRRPFWQLSTGAVDQSTGQVGGVIGALVPTQPEAKNSARNNTIGFYVQDTYKPLPNLTLGLGLRFEREAVSSHGFEFFEPAEQRAAYDVLQNLAGLENGADLNKDGVITLDLSGDPLYGECSNCRVTEVNGQLLEIAPKRLTRHNFLTDIESTLITDPQRLKNGRPRQPEDFTITNNNLAPRMSVSWDPWADGKSRASAGWNRYYDKLFLQTVIGEEGPDLLTPYYGFDIDGVGFDGKPNNQVGRDLSQSPPSANQVDRNLRTPFTDEITFGFSREIAPEVSVSFNYIHRYFRDQLQDVDVNHNTRKPPFGCAVENATPGGFCDDLGRTVVRPAGATGGEAGKGPDMRQADTYPDLYINNLNFNQVFRVGNYNYQEYVGYELQLVRRLSRKWQMDASYVFSKAQGQAEGFLSESGDDPAFTELKSGYLDYDQRHVAKFHAIAYLPGDWQLGGGLTWSSGLPYSFVNRFQSADSVDFAQTRRLFGHLDPNLGKFYEEPRNIHRNHAVYDISVRAEKKFVVGQVSAGTFFEVFDLLNSDDLRVFEIRDNETSLQALEIRDFGRRFQFGVALDF